jgi:hypothetical protein
LNGTACFGKELGCQQSWACRMHAKSCSRIITTNTEEKM